MKKPAKRRVSLYYIDHLASQASTKTKDDYKAARIGTQTERDKLIKWVYRLEKEVYGVKRK